MCIEGDIKGAGVRCHVRIIRIKSLFQGTGGLKNIHHKSYPYYVQSGQKFLQGSFSRDRILIMLGGFVKDHDLH